MKNMRLLFWAFIIMSMGELQSQVTVHLDLSPPGWGPAGHEGARYYYLPDVQAYYDVETSMFIYYHQNRWVRRTHLPTRYRNYDLYHGYKVVMTDYHGNEPYVRFKDYRVKYRKGYRGEEQRNIRERVIMNREKREHLLTNPERKSLQQERRSKSTEDYKSSKKKPVAPQRNDKKQTNGVSNGRR